MKNRLMYMLGVLIPSVSMIALVSMIVWLAYDFGFHDPSEVNMLSAVLRAAVIPVCIVLIRIFDPIRREYRQRMQTDQYGLRKKSFKDMSSKERRAMELQNMARDEQILSTAEWMSMVKNGSKNPDADLSDLVGIVPVKEKVLEMKAQMVYGGHGTRRPPNVCLLGNPGTGKTTVAGILTGFLAKYGFIKENRYVVVNGTSFGSSPDPVRRTNLILAKSKGKLLFIDEAYSLARSAYGQQILTIILDDMEKNRDGMALVLAGYKKEMKELFQMNSGLSSRIDDYLMFPDYTPAEMAQIETRMAAKKGYQITQSALSKSMYIFAYERSHGVFANARSARKAVESAASRHMYRVMEHQVDDNRVLDEDDFVIQTETVDYLSNL